MDITSNLEAALLDQQVAGKFAGQVYAFVVVYSMKAGAWYLGVAVADEDGFYPIDGKTFATADAAREWADGLNTHIGLTVDQAFAIIASTMGGRPYDARRYTEQEG